MVRQTLPISIEFFDLMFFCKLKILAQKRQQQFGINSMKNIEIKLFSEIIHKNVDSLETSVIERFLEDLTFHTERVERHKLLYPLRQIFNKLKIELHTSKVV